MQGTIKKMSLILVCIILISQLCGCTNWQKKHDALNVEHQNTLGLLERCRSEKGILATEVTMGQQTLEQLQKQISQRSTTAGEVTGFGPGYEVSLDAAAGTITVTLPNAILYGSGKANLKAATSSELNHIYTVLSKQYVGRQIDVVGHTDSDPIRKSKWKDNWELSAQRSLTVVRYLVKKGMNRSKIRAVGCGASRPIASNATSRGKARNRRVEIVVDMR